MAAVEASDIVLNLKCVQAAVGASGSLEAAVGASKCLGAAVEASETPKTKKYDLNLSRIFYFLSLTISYQNVQSL